MKDPTPAAIYATLYPVLAEIAKEHGYALAVHGSMARDLDLVAIPWTEEATDAETLVNAFRARFSMLYLHERMSRSIGKEITKCVGRDPTFKPHGRRAWSLYLDDEMPAYCDLSVMPRDPLVDIPPAMGG